MRIHLYKTESSTSADLKGFQMKFLRQKPIFCGHGTRILHGSVT
jgi:hypothetical protein